MLIGLTGSMGTGKSTVAARLSALGAHVLDADAFARELTERGSHGLRAVADAFGIGVLRSDGSLDRKKLAALVFSDGEKLKTLNARLHPLILSAMHARADAIFKKDARAVAVFDMPLLIETGEHERVDRVWLITADEETRVSRITARDGCTREEALRRFKTQMPQEEKLRYADIVIDNSDGLEALYARVDALYVLERERYGKT